jgi:hypothetical protein
LHEAIELHRGFVFQIIGDAFWVDFSLGRVHSDTISS